MRQLAFPGNMDEKISSVLKGSAIVLAVFWLIWGVFIGKTQESGAAQRDLSAASRFLEDGQYTEAARIYRTLSQSDPQANAPRYGLAMTLMQMAIPTDSSDQTKPLLEAELIFDELIDKTAPSGNAPGDRTLLAAYHANRGIVHDRLGHYPQALVDYQAALRLNPKLSEGPGLMTRFLRNQATRPPSIADRAGYLQKQLALPIEQRKLHDEKLDASQLSYKL